MLRLPIKTGWNLVCFFILCSCMDQYDPRAYWSKLKQERKNAHTVDAKLNADGSLPNSSKPQSTDTAIAASGATDVKDAKKVAEVSPAALTAAKTKYAQLCVSCHGDKGAGDGPVGAALTPKARNFTDKTWAASVDDERLYKVIAKGGPAVGLSPLMAPWESALDAQEITAMVQVVRGFSK